jgi:hypothetical protein
VGSKPGHLRRKILEYCEFHKRNSICQEAAKILQIRNTEKNGKIHGICSRNVQTTDTSSFRMRIEKDMKAPSLHGQNHDTVSNFGRVTSVMASTSYYRQQQYGQVHVKSNGFYGCQLF